MSADLRHALTVVAETGRTTAPDPAADLARARRAASARTRRRISITTSALATAVVVGVLGTVVVGNDAAPTSPPVAQSVQPVVLVAGPLEAAPYVFDRVPAGWVVQGQTPTAVTIVPEGGDVSADPDDFVGKLVILFDRNPLHGDPVVHDDRTFHAGVGEGYTTLSTRTRGDEPRGVVRVQYPNDAGWALPQMIDFLDGVRVTTLAEPGFG